MELNSQISSFFDEYRRDWTGLKAFVQSSQVTVNKWGKYCIYKENIDEFVFLSDLFQMVINEVSYTTYCRLFRDEMNLNECLTAIDVIEKLKHFYDEAEKKNLSKKTTFSLIESNSNINNQIDMINTKILPEINKIIKKSPDFYELNEIIIT